ncbi:MAG: NAD(P)-binding protein [Clostridiales bacterium]|nr:NAD(P)-binding protein [Clostridiales bacterium]
MKERVRVSQVTVPLEHDMDHVVKKACRISGIRPDELAGYEITRRSVDARRSEPRYSYTVDLIPSSDRIRIKKDKNVTRYTPVKYSPTPSGYEPLTAPIAVIGTGPAGLFAAYLLAKNGYAPIIFERGKEVDQRQDDVRDFWRSGRLNPESNVQFGEGGAGTFSDGKLNTRIKDRSGRIEYVLKTFVTCGAPEDILCDSQPHIGTDILCTVVRNMREDIIRLGGKFYFGSKVTDIEIRDGKLTTLIINDSRREAVSAAILALGHSARDSFAMLSSHGVPMEAKAFAVGMRVEHPQEMIDRAQYGENADMSLLPAASYSLTHRAANGRSVFTFCMCPGGQVIDASSEENCLAINGMSTRARDSGIANSAVIVSLTPDDYPDPDDPLSGVEFQRDLERKAYTAGEGRIPRETFADFEEETHSKLRLIFPEYISEAFTEGMHAFGKKISGFDRNDTLLSAVESRTSSPVRILRNEHFESSIKGLYPCGEGAGYAGGITSSAVDGLKVAESIMTLYLPPVK